MFKLLNSSPTPKFGVSPLIRVRMLDKSIELLPEIPDNWIEYLLIFKNLLSKVR